jgi:hypothetical protein
MQSRWNVVGVALAAMLGSGWVTSTQASDHQDGSVVRDEQAGDLTGLWAFVPDRGSRQGPLVVAMGIRSFAVSRSDIGTDYEYSFRIRRASLEGSGPGVRSRTGGSELKLTCRFNRARQVSCDMTTISARGDSSAAGSVTGDFDKNLTSLGRRIKVFADLRTDPYIVNLPALHDCMDGGEARFLGGDRKIANSFGGSHINTFGIIAEISQSLLPEDNGLPLVAVAAESVLVSDETDRRIDRVGRPETTVFLIQDDAARNAWNARDAFDSDGLDKFREQMQRGMTAVDAHSRKSYWAHPHPLMNVMLEDYLLLNPANPVNVMDSAKNHFLELEWAAFQGASIAGLSGGRRLTDNSVARFFSVFARRGASSFAHLDALRPPLFRPTQPKFPYMSGPLDRMENLSVRVLERLIPINGTIKGCE